MHLQIDRESVHVWLLNACETENVCECMCVCVCVCAHACVCV